MLSENATSLTGDVVARQDVQVVSRRVIVPWLTGEVALYIILGAVALGLRLMSLGERPLDLIEARQALAAWQFVSGQPVEVVGYSPLMFLGNAITFALFGASDFSARLAPALMGMVLVFSPVLYRRWLGRWGSLLASVFLAISPTALYYSRHLSGEIAVVACALVLVAAKMHFLEKHDTGALKAAVIALALMFTAGPGAYSVLAVGAVFAVILFVSGRMGYGTEEWDRVRSAWRTTLNTHRGIEGQLLLLFVLTILLVGTSLLMYFPGFQAVIDQFSLWMGQLGPVPGGVAWYHHILLLLLYEPLILLFGVIGIVFIFRQRHLVTTFLVYWGLVILYLYTLFGGKSSGDLLLALGPLALIAGLAAGNLIEDVTRLGLWEIDGLFVGILAPIGVYILLQLSGYGQTGQMPYLWLLAIGVLLVLGLFVGYLFWLGPQAAGRSLGLALLIFLLLSTWGISWQLNYNNVSDPREIMLTRPTDVSIRDMMSTLRDLSVWRSGDIHELPVTVVKMNDPVVRWYLREFRDVRYTGALGDNLETQIYIAPASFTDAGLEELYRGQQFALRSSWTVPVMQGPAFVKWWLYREAREMESQDIVLWAKGGGGLGLTAR